MKPLFTWLGLLLLLIGSSLLVLPLIPARPAVGAMANVPHWPWVSAGMLILGLIVLRLARPASK